MLTPEKKEAARQAILNTSKESLTEMYIECADNFSDIILNEFIKKDFGSVDEMKAKLAKLIDYQEVK